MSQPSWRFIANLGDATPLEYGGYFIYTDETGEYAPEAEYYDADIREAYRFSLDRCTFIDGILSDNEFHPDHPAWFASHVKGIASACGTTPEEVIEALCSPDALQRAEGYRMIGSVEGWENLDSDPLRLTRKEARERYQEESK